MEVARKDFKQLPCLGLSLCVCIYRVPTCYTEQRGVNSAIKAPTALSSAEPRDELEGHLVCTTLSPSSILDLLLINKCPSLHNFGTISNGFC